ncbi:hypothetical protein [Ensifer aridi]|uniref:hypothetical protein n=1 Tax=Ensifer aridi TaxID=1708715 RepID=UPI003B8A6EAC
MQGLALLVQEGLGRDPFLCAERDMWRRPSRRQPRPAKSGILRHIIFRASRMGVGFPYAAIPEGQYARVLFFVWWGAQAPT